MILHDLNITLENSQSLKLVLKDPTRKIIQSELVTDGSHCAIRYSPTVPGKYLAELWNCSGVLFKMIPIDTVLHVGNKQPQNQVLESDPRVVSLATPIQPADANHSYNGIMFDIKSKGPEDVEVLGFVVGGTLGPTSIYVRSGPWKEDVTPETWSKVLSCKIEGSWDRTTYVPLSVPVTVLAKETRGFYIHCSVHHDDALTYQTYHSFGEVIVQDKHIVLFPGQARCGSSPFGRDRWRTVRGLSGTVRYRSIRKVWTPKIHCEFPRSFKRIVRLLLLMWYREDSIFHQIPQEALYEILKFMDWDWFEVDQKALLISEPSDSHKDGMQFMDWDWM